MSLRVKLDNFVPNDQPIGMDELEIKVVFNHPDKTFLQDTNDTEIIFIGDAYVYLLDSFRNNGYNGIHTLEIQKAAIDGTFAKIFSGKIFISDCEFDLDKRFCKTNVIDTGYNTFINNNSDIEANFTIPKTKNGLDIAQSITPDSVYLINPPSKTVPATGIFTGTTFNTLREIYNVSDVLKFLISFMSDNELSYASDFLDEVYDTSKIKIGLISGENLRTNSTDVYGQISWNQLFGDLGSLLNLILSIDTSTGGFVARVENTAYYKNRNVVLEKESVSNIKLSYAQELLYSNLSLGSVQNVVDGSVGDLTYVPPYDFGSDDYYVGGVGNIKNTLSLETTTLITDNNIIEDVIINNNDQYDEDWFLISYQDLTDTIPTYPLQAWTDQGNIFSDGSYYYNGIFTNIAVASRYALQGGIIKTQGDTSGDFLGLKGSAEEFDYVGSPVVSTGGFPFTRGRVFAGNFDDILADPSGAWNTSTNRYTAATNGVRNIRFEVNTRVTNPGDFNPFGNIGYTVYLVAARFKINGSYVQDPSTINAPGQFEYMGRTKDTIIKVNYDPTQTSSEKVVYEYPIYLAAADYLEIEVGMVMGQSLWNGLNSVNQILFSDLPPEYKYIRWWYFLEYPYFTQNPLVDILGSSVLEVRGQGSINGVGIGEGVEAGFYVNKYTFEDYLSGEELITFLKSPQNAIRLLNTEHNIDSNVWAYNVSINAKTGKTSFELFNNINNI